MLSSASIQVFVDISMVLLPQRLIWSLHITWQRKLGISIIFGVGLLASVAACFRLWYTVKYFKDPDRMYFISPLLFWACAEMTCGFFILSMPYLPRIIAGSRLPRKVKVVLGLSVQPTNRSNHDNFEPCRGSHGKSSSTVTSNSLSRSGSPAFQCLTLRGRNRRNTCAAVRMWCG
ncbi:hypothetical protein V2G26_019104 [Clonostachys chloroleuca]